MKDVSCDVLVVGLGPVGAMLAGLLRNDGLSVVAIDREGDVYPLPRAGAFDAESMRIFQSLGLAETLLPLCRVMDGYEFLAATGETLMRFDIPPVPGPLGWSATYVLHQPSIERALRERLAELGVDMRLNTKLVGFTQDGDGVSAQVETVNGAATITARYLVGCDGANSRVRETIGGEPFDYGFSEAWLVIDAVVENGEGLPEIATQILDPAQPTTFMRMTGNRFRWEFMLKPGDDPDQFASDDNIALLLARWNEGDRIKLERRALYRFRGVVASRWRNGRAMLAGDAAHLMPPFAGQGMCSGFRDAANLSWKLTSVSREQTDESLLDSYQQEREPHVRGIIERSIEFGKMICILDPAVAAQRNAGLLAMRAAGTAPPMLPDPPLIGGCLMETADAGALFIQPVINGARLDDQLGSGPWLIVRDGTDVPAGYPTFSIAAGALGAFARPVGAWLAERGADAVLVRPDRRIFGIGAADTLVAAWLRVNSTRTKSQVNER